MTNLPDLFHGSCSDVMCPAFQEAFDKVAHEGLLSKLESAGLQANPDLFGVWPTGRNCVLLSGDDLEWLPVAKSVP